MLLAIRGKEKKNRKIGKINFRGIFLKQGNSFGRREDCVFVNWFQLYCCHWLRRSVLKWSTLPRPQASTYPALMCCVLRPLVFHAVPGGRQGTARGHQGVLGVPGPAQQQALMHESPASTACVPLLGTPRLLLLSLGWEPLLQTLSKSCRGRRSECHPSPKPLRISFLLRSSEILRMKAV